MKKNYTIPTAEIVKLNAADIITSSLVATNDPKLTENLLDELDLTGIVGTSGWAEEVVYRSIFT